LAIDFLPWPFILGELMRKDPAPRVTADYLSLWTF
jgi:hypothetical protein